MASKREGGEKQWRAGLSDVKANIKANRHAPWLSAWCVYPPLPTFLPAWTSWLSPCTVSCLSLWRSLCVIFVSNFPPSLYFFSEQSQSGFLSHLQQVNTADTLWRTPIAGAVPKSQKGISGIYQKMTAGIESIINNLLLYNAPTRSRVIMTSLL